MDEAPKWIDIPGRPNKFIQFDGFYISFNTADYLLYGSVTTALVPEVNGNPTYFYILNGDHRKEYEKLAPEGFESCLKYFKDNQYFIAKYSDRLEEEA